MPSAEWVNMPSRVALIDHRHPAAHMLVVLDGEVHEDGRVYRTGDIRISSAEDRHFLTSARISHCLIIEGVSLQPTAPPRRVLRAPVLVSRLRGVTAAEEAIELASARDLGEALEDREPPSWLQELELRRSQGRFIRTKNVKAIASMAGVSREHLARCYQRHFGSSVTDAMRVRRLHQAFDAVTGSTLSLAEVADECGFSDQSHMTRQFSAWIGITPGTLRRTRKNVTSVQDAGRAAAI